MNKNLDIVLKTSYFYGSRFYKNRAIVCKDKSEYAFYEDVPCNVIGINGNLLLDIDLKYEKVLELLNKGKI